MLDRRHFLIAAAASSMSVGCDETQKHDLATTSAKDHTRAKSGVADSSARNNEPQIRDVKTIASLPRSAGEIKDLYDRASSNSAELLPDGEPFEIKGFAPYLTKRDEIEAGSRRPNTCSRRHVMSVGLEMLTDDQKHLPLLSREQILTYLRSNYVTLQARIYREPVSRSLYLGTRCLAATRLFRGATTTQPFTPPVAESVNCIRSLGLLLPNRSLPTPSNLRTLVMVHKNQLSQEGTGMSLAKSNYEYVFVRAHATKHDALELHAFSTSDERTRLHWLKPAESPAMPSDCSVRGAIYFTEYTHQGLYPKTAVIRRSLIIGQKTFTWDKLDQFARKTYRTSLLESLTQVLDSIIAGDVRDF